MAKIPDGYEVTSDGSVYSVESNWRGYGKREMAKILNSGGYPSVRLMIDGKRKRVAVHTLVAAAFLGPKPSKAHQIRHLDGDKNNSSASNLAWGTAKENANDREMHGRTSRGEKHSLAIKGSSHLENVRKYHANKATGQYLKGEE